MVAGWVRLCLPRAAASCKSRKTGVSAGTSLALYSRKPRIRSEQAMQLNRKWMYFAIVPMVAAAVPGAAWVIGGRDSTAVNVDAPNLYLVVDKSDKRLKMFEADTLLWQYPISDGTA